MGSFNAHLLSAMLCDGGVLLDYQLGLADGMTLMCRRGTEPDFSPLAEDEPGPVVDARPNLIPHLPEVRHYRAILRYSAGETLRFTNEITVIVPHGLAAPPNYFSPA